MKAKKKEGLINITLLGIGSTKDVELKKNTVAAGRQLGIDLMVEEVYELEQLLKHNIIGIPTMMINDEIVFEKEVPSVEQIANCILQKYSALQNFNTMNKILVPTDFSENARNATAYALEIANQHGCEVTLLHTYKLYSTAGMMISVESYMAEDRKKEMDQEVKLFETQLRNGATIDTRVVRGDAIPTIKSFAEKGKYDLVIMGTQGASGVEEVFLGSVTNGVIKNIKTPLLAIPNGYRFKAIEDIVFSIDNDPIMSDDIIKPLLELAEKDNAQIKLFHHAEQEGSVHIDPSVTKALNGAEYSLHYEINSEELGESIHQFVEKSDADLLCMIRRKRGFWESLFHSSATTSEAFHSEIPLLVLHE
ncbi:MAG: universal stress protein [Saprospiraceae bacterium]|nr:universal stress protein [Saprospiraceae bacterium]